MTLMMLSLTLNDSQHEWEIKLVFNHNSYSSNQLQTIFSLPVCSLFLIDICEEFWTAIPWIAFSLPTSNICTHVSLISPFFLKHTVIISAHTSMEQMQWYQSRAICVLMTCSRSMQSNCLERRLSLWFLHYMPTAKTNWPSCFITVDNLLEKPSVSLQWLRINWCSAQIG